MQKWIDFINDHNPTKMNEKQLDREKMKLCHMHFEKNQVVTKSNNDRVLIRNSVPRCPPGIIDKAHAFKKSKSNKKSKKVKETKGSNSQTNKSETTVNTDAKSKTSSAIADGPPLYHTINGYVVDLRIAALQETFRLPNGKLIQVRRQPKKSSGPETEPPHHQLPTRPQPQSKSPTSSAQLPKPNGPAVSGSPVLELPTGPARSLSVLPTPLTSTHSTRPSKTYTNRRSVVQPARTPAALRANASSDTTIGPVVYPPTLSSLQALMHKTHEETQFGNQMKEFENRLINIAEISLHVVSKINNLLNSNPYKNAADSRDIKYLYHSLGYLLEYAVGRFNGVEQSCVKDIRNMGYTNKCDLGPLIDKLGEETPTEKETSTDKPTEESPPATKPTEDKSPTEPLVEKSTPKAVEEKAPEPQPESPESEEPDEDDDCAIIEPRTDIIEVDSDDDSDDDDNGSGGHPAEPATSSLNPRQLRICSDTESIDRDESSNQSGQSGKAVPQKESLSSSKEKQANVQQQSSVQAEAQTIEETTEIEVVMNEVEETTIVHDYYYEAYTDDDEDGDDVQVQQADIETMEVDDDDDGDSSNSREKLDGEEETEELIEIIEGDIDLELEEGQEYKVIEVVEGDLENW